MRKTNLNYILKGLFMFFLGVQTVLGQAPKVKPDSPNVASLMKFTEIPVSTFNGTANVSIPIYEINVGGISVPINLAYHTSGVKVADEASWVGLGWVLNAGGVINGIVEKTPEGPEIYPHSLSVVDRNNADSPYTVPITNIIEAGVCYRDVNGTLINLFSLGSIGKSRQDKIISYNFGSYSGKFIKGVATQALTFDKTNIKFETYSNATNTSSRPYYYKATTPDGLIYTFETVGLNLHPSGAGGSEISNSWYVSEIKSQTGQTVKFTYTVKTILSLPTTDESRTICQQYVPLNTENKSISNGSTIEEYYLDKIEFDNGYVKFEVSDRDDLWTSPSAKASKLDAIKIYDKANVLVKKFTMLYDYFVGDVKHGDYTLQGNYSSIGLAIVPEDIKRKRLKLLSIKEEGTSPYLFEYNSTTLPYKTAFAQDLWGYFNGLVPAFEQRSLLPNGLLLTSYIKSIPPELLTVGTGYRLPDEASMKAGVLTKVTYPTGGNSQFELEAHNLENGSTPTTVIRPTAKGVYDVGVGLKTEIIDVPDVGLRDSDNLPYNPGKLDIILWCCGPNANNCTNCPSCNESNVYADPITGTLPNMMFATLEYFDPILNGYTNPPGINKDYDRTKSYMIKGTSCGGSFDSQGTFDNLKLRPGKYRIRANFPDSDYTGDVAQSKYASIRLQYLEPQTTSTFNKLIVGGLRTKSITNYSDLKNIAFKKDFTYESPTVMSSPVYTRKINSSALYAPKGRACSLTDPCVGGESYAEISVIQSTINSNPLNPYTYAADGSLVGYGKVTINNGNNGREVYEYHVQQDQYFYSATWNSNPPGLPNIPYFLNGKLKQKSILNSNNLLIEQEDYEYKVEGSRVFWNYIVQYQEKYRSVPEPPFVLPYSCRWYDNETYFFYPVKTGRVNVIQRNLKTISY